jgi:hypothetical protein
VLEPLDLSETTMMTGTGGTTTTTCLQNKNESVVSPFSINLPSNVVWQRQPIRTHSQLQEQSGSETRPTSSSESDESSCVSDQIFISIYLFLLFIYLFWDYGIFFFLYLFLFISLILLKFSIFIHSR